MKFTIKTIILLACLAIVFGFLFRFADRNEYEILKPEIVGNKKDMSSWEIIMDVKKESFKNIEKNWQKKHIHERK
jgi:hypothetical protein